MKRIAFFGPLPPLNTGVADYNEALLPMLRQHYEIDVYVSDSKAPGEGLFHGEFLIRNQQNPYDLTLYQMGNQPDFHEYMYGYLFQHPGAIVFHDYCLHHSRAGMLLKRSMRSEYREELKFAYPQHAEQLGNAMISFAAGDLLYFHYPLFELVLRSSLAAGVHTDAAVQKLQISETPVIKIPQIELPDGNCKSDRLPGKTVVASFGFVTQAKRVSTILNGISSIRDHTPDLVYVIVGAVEDPKDLNVQINKLGLADQVIVTGHTDMKDFREWMTRADIIVNLRYPSAGEMSSTLIQALGLGKPVIISRLLALQEIPENAVLRVRPDREEEDLKRALGELLQKPELRTQLSFSARKYIQEHHSTEKVLKSYRNLIETAIQRKASYIAPPLPAHLQSGREIIRQNLLNTSFNNVDSKILEWLPDTL
jgi:glycosyltransferase involved in cell wall biosynthesis